MRATAVVFTIYHFRQRHPAEALKEKLCAKGFDAFIYESPIDKMKKQIAAGEKPNINLYFAGKNDSLLRFTKTSFNGRIFANVCINGSSEMVSNLSASVVNVLYNFQLLRFAGEDGVAAYGIIMYVNFIFMAMFFGYSIGSSPIVGFHYGAGNHNELKNMFKKSITLILITGVILTLIAEIFASPLVNMFAGYDGDLFEMTKRGFMIYSLSFLLMGFNVWGSAFFTALNNGVVSAAMSFLRTLVFQIAAVFILPIFIGIDGIWFAVNAAEGAAVIVTLIFIIKLRNRYQYV